MTKAEYIKIHKILAMENGKATHCSNPDCKYQNPRRFEWALIKGRQYSTSISDYIPLCPSCHRKYDYTEEMRIKNSMMRKGRIWHNRMRKVRKIFEHGYQEYSSITVAAKENGMKGNSIGNLLIWGIKNSWWI